MCTVKILEIKQDVVKDDEMVGIDHLNSHPKKKQSKKAKAVSATIATAETKALTTKVVKKGPEMIDLSNTLKILSEIRSMTVDAIADQPHCGKTLAAGDDEDYTVAPTPLDVLAQLEQFDDLIRSKINPFFEFLKLRYI